MVEIKKVVFAVQTGGEGQPDYSQPQSLMTAGNTLIVKYPETEVSANRFDDYAEVSVTTAAQTVYIIGTNANLQKSDSWSSGVVAKSITFYATEDILVRFNNPDAVQHEIPAELLKSFAKRAERLYIQAKYGAATVKIWIEG